MIVSGSTNIICRRAKLIASTALYLTDGATNTDTNIFGSVASTGLELPDLNGTTTATTTVTETGSSELEPIATLNTTDLEDWNTFMRNVDEALFEVGVGR